MRTKDVGIQQAASIDIERKGTGKEKVREKKRYGNIGLQPHDST